MPLSPIHIEQLLYRYAKGVAQEFGHFDDNGKDILCSPRGANQGSSESASLRSLAMLVQDQAFAQQHHQ